MSKVLILLCALVAAAQGRLLNPLSSRIVNGVEAKLGEIPFQVSLQLPSGFHFCGGSILSKDWVVTAAHCADGQSASLVQVVAGTINYKQPGQKRQADKLIIHEDYSLFTIRNDIALIKLKTPFDFDELVAPVQLPELHQKVETDSRAVVSGWGYTGFGSSVTPLLLLKAEIQIADPAYCERVMRGTGNRIYPTNVCAYDPVTRRGQCNGDSGGPLVVDGKLTGIVSWSVKDPYCASTKYPGVYTRVSEYVDWINKNAV